MRVLIDDYDYIAQVRAGSAIADLVVAVAAEYALAAEHLIVAKTELYV